MKTFVMGIDGGGSKTEAILSEISSGKSVLLYSGGINSLTDGADKTAINLKSVIHKAKEILVREQGQLTSIFIGAAGNMTGNPIVHWTVKMLSEAFPNSLVNGDIDSRIALEGATNGRPGVLVIAGTGSIACSLSPKGVIERCGGWGPRFGDEGSGYFIGCEALRAVAREWDKRGRATLITQQIKERLKVSNEAELIEKVYTQMDRKDISSLANEVGMAAAKRDKVAIEILHLSAKHLAQQVMALLHEIDWHDVKPIITYSGGVFKMGELILGPLRRNLGRWADYLQKPYSKPVNGAVILAIKEYESFNSWY
jgi:N-acetylglucosamine kinase-like BadF-type ATPase